MFICVFGHWSKLWQMRANSGFSLVRRKSRRKDTRFVFNLSSWIQITPQEPFTEKLCFSLSKKKRSECSVLESSSRNRKPARGDDDTQPTASLLLHSSHNSRKNEEKMKLAIVASLVASAAAFAPAQTGKASTALNMAFEEELGAQVRLARKSLLR